MLEHGQLDLFSNEATRLEDSFRRHGVDGEDVFYALELYYIRQFNVDSSILPKRFLKHGEQALEKTAADSEIQSALDSMVASDPEGRNLPTWYQNLLGRRIRGRSGKFFTPIPIASAMASLLPVSDGAVVMDPTCGGGTFLVEASRVWEAHKCVLIANDVDASLAGLAQLILALRTPGHHEKVFATENIYQPAHELNKWHGKVDCILANPPFRSKLKCSQPHIANYLGLVTQLAMPCFWM